MPGPARSSRCVEICVEMAQCVEDRGVDLVAAWRRCAARPPRAAPRRAPARRSASMPASITPAASRASPRGSRATARPSGARREHGHAVGRDHARPRAAARARDHRVGLDAARALCARHDARAVHLARPQQRCGRRVAARAEAVADAARARAAMRMLDARTAACGFRACSQRCADRRASEVRGQLRLEAHPLAARRGCTRPSTRACSAGRSRPGSARSRPRRP